MNGSETWKLSGLLSGPAFTNIEGLGTEWKLQELGSAGVVVWRDGGFGMDEGQLHPSQLVIVVVRILLGSTANPRQLLVFGTYLIIMAFSNWQPLPPCTRHGFDPKLATL
jgi:hypothetical protein